LAFSFQHDEFLAKGTKRIARKQIDRVLDQLSLPSGSDRVEAVHDARKRFKRIRALLRLVRKSIGTRRYRLENACFRDAGRPLAEVRDARVLVVTFAELTRRITDQVSGSSLAEVNAALMRRQDAVSQRVFDEEGTLLKVADILQAARRRIKKWTFDKNERSTFHAGLKRVYKRGRKAFSAANAEPTVENLHEWRKRVKDLWHQLQLLKPAWPAITADLVNQVHALGDHLGVDHDLAVLRNLLADDSVKLGDRTAIEALLPRIDCRRSELQQAAQMQGQQIYRDRPKNFLSRLEAKH
jgi:CHAD domain-containing protein